MPRPILEFERSLQAHMNQPWIRYLPSFLRKKVEGRAYLQNVVTNTGWQFADNILRMGIGLFVGVWVTRYLGPDQFGVFSYALAFAALFLSLTSLDPSPQVLTLCY